MTGQNAALANQSQRELKNLNDSYNNLTARLGIATKSRETNAAIAEMNLGFIDADIKTLQDANDKLGEEEGQID